MKNFVEPGNIIDVVESVLTHPTETDGLIVSGDQGVVGDLAGVANITALASTDTIPMSIRGVFTLLVKGTNAGGNVAVAFGDAVFIDAGANADISKNSTKKPFGIALGAVASGNTTTKIPVLLVSQVTSSVAG